MKKTKPTDADLKESKKNIQYWIYDLPSEDDTFEIRSQSLYDLFMEWSYFNAHCINVDTDICQSEKEVMEYYEKYVNDGFEGQMLRLNKEYENKRSKSLMKHKSFVDEEYTILDIVEGEGIFTTPRVAVAAELSCFPRPTARSVPPLGCDSVVQWGLFQRNC